MKQIEKHISCGIIPIFMNEQGEREFLLVELHHGGISFPKGHIENGETFLQTAKRELQEETGLVCTSINTEHMISGNYLIERPEKHIDKTVHYFIGYVGDKTVTIQPEEIKNYFWLSTNDCMEKINFNGAKQVFKEALGILSNE